MKNYTRIWFIVLVVSVLPASASALCIACAFKELFSALWLIVLFYIVVIGAVGYLYVRLFMWLRSKFGRQPEGANEGRRIR